MAKFDASKLERELRAEREKGRRINQEKLALEKENSELLEDNHQLRDAIESRDQSLQKVKNDCSQTEREKSQLESKLEILQQKLARNEDDIDKLKNSLLENRSSKDSDSSRVHNLLKDRDGAIRTLEKAIKNQEEDFKEYRMKIKRYLAEFVLPFIVSAKKEVESLTVTYRITTRINFLDSRKPLKVSFLLVWRS